MGISLGIIGESLEKGTISTDLTDDVTPVHVTIQFQCYKLREAQAPGAARPFATTMQRGGDINRPMCRSSSTNATIQAHYGESSSVQDDESDSHTYQSLLDKISCEHHGLSI